MPEVSICIPAYNQAERLEKAINSVLVQTFTDYEIVITDDSLDTSVKEVVAKYNLPNKIKYYKNQVTLGSPENWNESIRKATGKYIKILHHDDWLNFNDSLEKYVALLDDNPESEFGFSATQALSPSGFGYVHVIGDTQLNELKKNPLLLCVTNMIGAPSTTIFRNNTALEFDPKLKWHVDTDYYIRRINKNQKIVYSPELLVVTYLLEGRVSDECKGNRQIEVFEYFYMLEKITKEKQYKSAKHLKVSVLRAIALCTEYNIAGVNEIRDCGFKGTLHASIRTYLLINRFSSLVAMLFIKLLRKSNWVIALQT